MKPDFENTLSGSTSAPVLGRQPHSPLRGRFHEEVVATPPVADRSLASAVRLELDRLFAELAFDRTVALQLQSVGEPDVEDGVHKEVHHLRSVVRSGSEAQQFLAARHRRVIDRLEVDAVLGHQIVRQFDNHNRITDLKERSSRSCNDLLVLYHFIYLAPLENHERHCLLYTSLPAQLSNYDWMKERLLNIWITSNSTSMTWPLTN